MYTQTHTHTYMYVCKYIYIYPCVYIHIYIYTHVCVLIPYRIPTATCFKRESWAPSAASARRFGWSMELERKNESLIARRFLELHIKCTVSIFLELSEFRYSAKLSIRPDHKTCLTHTHTHTASCTSPHHFEIFCLRRLTISPNFRIRTGWKTLVLGQPKVSSGRDGCGPVNFGEP